MLARSWVLDGNGCASHSAKGLGEMLASLDSGRSSLFEGGANGVRADGSLAVTEARRQQDLVEASPQVPARRPPIEDISPLVCEDEAHVRGDQVLSDLVEHRLRCSVQATISVDVWFVGDVESVGSDP
jgi:hypothetical protein